MTQEELKVLAQVQSKELVDVGQGLSPFPEGTKARRTKTGDVVVDYSGVPRPERKPSPVASALVGFAAGLTSSV